MNQSLGIAAMVLSHNIHQKKEYVITKTRGYSLKKYRVQAQVARGKGRTGKIPGSISCINKKKKNYSSEDKNPFEQRKNTKEDKINHQSKSVR